VSMACGGPCWPGRMSTRQLQTPLGEVSIDPGAQYLTARDPSFREQVSRWSGLGIVEPWPIAGADAWVGVPGMSAIVREMARGHDVSWSCQITGLALRERKYWLLGAGGESEPFDTVVLAVPAEQAAVILSLHDLEMTRLSLDARSQPCWAAMFVFDRQLSDHPQVIRANGPVAWAARNSAKPGRTGPDALIVQASAAWTNDRLAWPREQVAKQLLHQFDLLAVTERLEPITSAAHLWRYALSAGTGNGAMWNPQLRLGVCGDWLLGPRIECAWLSGRSLAQRMGSTVGHWLVPSASQSQSVLG